MLNLHKLCFIALLVAAGLAGLTPAQDPKLDRKWEVGAQFATLQNRSGYWPDDASGVGGGGRLTYNFNPQFALEGEVNYFPGAGYLDVRRWQALVGAKTGVRFRKAGVFGKVRPGVMTTRFEVPIVCIQAPCLPYRETRAHFALDVGGVVEFYPADRIVVRFDAGDTIVRRNQFYASPLATQTLAIYAPNLTSHNFQLNAGVGFRF